MPSIPRIKESAVRRWTDEVYFQRGKSYFEQGAVYDQRRQGMTLKSKCTGTQAPFYRQLNETQAWQTLIADIRGRYKKLPALRDESDRLSL